MATESIAAIKDSLPPATDYLTYLTILESHLSPEILPTLNEILQDAELTQNIGWDLIHLLLPMPGADQCLSTIGRLGNPREVVLKITEALQLLELEEEEEEEFEVEVEVEKPADAEPTTIDRFCTLISLLSIIHPRIKTKYPSRFLSTSLVSILSTFRPSNKATLTVISFVHTVSGKKRPPLPGRKSSLKVPTTTTVTKSDPSAPDPEAQEEDPHEAAIQAKLLQSFVTHILEDYANAHPLQWAARLQESFEPGKIVTGKKSVGETFREDPALQTRDTIVGQLVALARDLGLSDYETLFEAIYKAPPPPSDDDAEENYPSSPDDIPLSKGGSLFLIASFVFSSILFGSGLSQPKLTIFPELAQLVKRFIGIDSPAEIGSEESGVIDAILALGLWLEHTNAFVSGPLEDEDFLQLLQSLSLLSANTPSPTLRYAAHVLTSSLLHAHPVDRLRLTFISDTLENCPYEALKGSAVSWLKEEIITANERKSENVFASTVALAATRPYLFPDTSALAEASDEELVQELEQSFPFHMAVVNFLFFVSGKQYKGVVPQEMMPIVEEIYLGPLRAAQEKCLAIFGDEDAAQKLNLDLLSERIAMATAVMD